MDFVSLIIGLIVGVIIGFSVGVVPFRSCHSQLVQARTDRDCWRNRFGDLCDEYEELEKSSTELASVKLQLGEMSDVNAQQVKRIETLEQENANLRGMILEAKNVLMES